jgi:uncharacterized protein (TIGR02145 family)
MSRKVSVVTTLTVLAAAVILGFTGCGKHVQKQGQGVTADEQAEAEPERKTESDDGFEFVVSKDGETVMITGYTGGRRRINIPTQLQGLPVTAIADSAFAGKRLTDVTIPNSVTAIGKFAFLNNRLTDVTIPNSVTIISEAAFFDNRLTDVTIPNSVTTIGKQAFDHNQLTSVIIPDGVTTIDKYAFFYNRLTDVTIPNSVTMIGNGAFAKNQLTNVIIPDGVTTIEVGAFESNQLTSVTIPNSVTTIEWGAFGDNRLTDVTIPNSVTTIGKQAFYYNQLTDVIIPSSVTTIGEMAFAGNQLTSVTIPQSVTTIGVMAFTQNPITSFSVASDNTAYTAQNSFFMSKDEKHLFQYFGSEENVTIPNSVTTIEGGAFLNSRLIGVTIPNSVTTIGEQAFRGNQLTGVTIPNSVVTIGDNAFSSNRLTGITIPNSVVTIGDNAFSSNQLTGITIPNSVVTIGDNAFNRNRLTDVIIGNNVTVIGKEAFAFNGLTDIAIPSSVTTIGAMAFIHNPLTNVSVAPGNIAYTIKDSFLMSADGKRLVLYFGDEESIAIPANVSVIDSWVFNSWVFNNMKLTSVTIPNGVTKIENTAFANNLLTDITIPNSVTEIGESAFAGNQLTNITIGANVEIHDNAFDNRFVSFYNAQGRAADTYTLRDGRRWSSEQIEARAKLAAPSPTDLATIDSAGILTDPRDGQTYRTVKTGGLTWMAENLKHVTDSSWCYDNDESNCQKYGRLYSWDAAMTACPAGWRLPTRDDWSNLIDIAGSFYHVPRKLRSKTGWNDLGEGFVTGTDDFGFSAMPGGIYSYADYVFNGVGEFGIWWIEMECGTGNSLAIGSRFGRMSMGTVDDIEDPASSVRCVQGTIQPVEPYVPIPEYENGFVFIASPDGNSVKIIRYRGEESEVSIPAELQGMAVTTISFKAFAGEKLTRITIGANIEIHDDAFDNDFPAFYNAQNRASGTYTLRDDGEWSKE